MVKNIVDENITRTFKLLRDCDWGITHTTDGYDWYILYTNTENKVVSKNIDMKEEVIKLFMIHQQYPDDFHEELSTGLALAYCDHMALQTSNGATVDELLYRIEEGDIMPAYEFVEYWWQLFQEADRRYFNIVNNTYQKIIISTHQTTK